MNLWTKTCMQLQSRVSASTHARKDPNKRTKLHRYFTDWVVNNVFSNRFTNQRMHTQKPWDCVVYAVASNPPMIRAQAHSKTIIFKKQGASTKGSNSLPLLLPRLLLEPRIDERSQKHETWRRTPRPPNGLYVGFSYSTRLNPNEPDYMAFYSPRRPSGRACRARRLSRARTCDSSPDFTRPICMTPRTS